MEDRITHDGFAYAFQTGILSNVTADKGRGKKIIAPSSIPASSCRLFWNDPQICGLPKIDPHGPNWPELIEKLQIGGISSLEIK